MSETRTSIDRRNAVSGEAIRARIGPVGGHARPLWSVMIPTHDCAPFLRDTLASVLAQDPGQVVVAARYLLAARGRHVR